MRKFNQKYLQNWENIGRRFILLISCKNVSKMRQKVVPNWSQNASIWGLWGTFGDAILHLLCMSPQSALKAPLKEPKSSPKASSKHPQSIPQAFRKLCRISPRGTKLLTNTNRRKKNIDTRTAQQLANAGGNAISTEQHKITKTKQYKLARHERTANIKSK